MHAHMLDVPVVRMRENVECMLESSR